MYKLTDKNGKVHEFLTYAEFMRFMRTLIARRDSPKPQPTPPANRQRGSIGHDILTVIALALLLALVVDDVIGWQSGRGPIFAGAAYWGAR